MKRLTRLWIKKADGDFQIVQRELRARKLPNYDAACFHAQQCIEKYLKARLQEEAIAFARLHELAGKMLNRLLGRIGGLGAATYGIDVSIGGIVHCGYTCITEVGTPADRRDGVTRRRKRVIGRFGETRGWESRGGHPMLVRPRI